MLPSGSKGLRIGSRYESLSGSPGDVEKQRGVRSGIKAPCRVAKTRPREPEIGANQPVGGKGVFRLTFSLIFGNLIPAREFRFPVSRWTARPPLRGLFCFWGLISFQNG